MSPFFLCVIRKIALNRVFKPWSTCWTERMKQTGGFPQINSLRERNHHLYITKKKINKQNYYTVNSLSLFWLAESVQWLFEIIVCDVITADYTIIKSRTLKVTGNHVIYDRGAWFLRVIMSCHVCALWCLPSVKKQKHFFFLVFGIVKQLLPPQGFGPGAKTRGGTLGLPGYIHTRTKNIC